MFIFIVYALCTIFNFNSSTLLYAQNPSDADFDRRIFMPRTLGLSGSMGARINLNESLYINPASSAHSRCFSVDGGYMWSKNSFFTNRMDNFYINAVDTDSEVMGGGAGFYKRRVKGGAGSEWEVRGMLNKVILGKRLGFGVSFSHLAHTYYNQSSSNFNLDVGLMYLLFQKTIIGTTFYNALGDDDDIRTRSVDFSVRQTFWDFFAASLSFEHRFNKKVYFSGGLEMLYRNGIMITVSGRRNQHLKTTSWGLGLGYVAPKVSFVYGTMNSVDYPYNFQHSFSVRVFF